VGVYLEVYSQDNTAHYNNIYNNTDYGIDASDNDDYTINATNNYWGAASGPYHAVNNTQGEGDNITDFVEFDPWLEEVMNWPPKARIDSISPDPAVEGENIRFAGHDAHGGTIVRYVWRSSIDGEFYNGTEKEFGYSDLSVEEHIIYFKIENSTGVWSDEVSETLVVTEKPQAYIDAISPEPAVEGQTVSFEGHGTDDGTIQRYAWRSSIDSEFYNGTGSKFNHDGLSNGTHTIYLRVQDNYGVWSGEVSATLTINGKPRAHIDTISPDPALDTETVSFEGHGTDDGTIQRYVWRSSLDGEIHNDTTADFDTDELTVGEHTIYFKVQDDYGIWSNESSKTLIVTERPVAYIDSISPDPACDTDTIFFNATATDDGTIERYVWSSDLDGELHNGTLANFTSRELRSGHHTITLRVQDNHGVWSEVVNTMLTVHGKPTAIITFISPRPAVEGESVLFKGNGTDDGTLTLYTWRSSIDGELYNGTLAEFDDNTLSNGTHTVYLRVKDDLDVWSKEVSTTLTINGLPRAKIDGIHPIKTTPGDTISFYGNGTDDGTVEGYEWRSDIDGRLSGEPSFSILNLSLGNHTISFRVKDDSGVWSLGAIADTLIAVEKPGLNSVGILVDLTSGKTEIVTIEGTNVTLGLFSTTDLLDERIEIQETTDHASLDIDPLGPARYVNIRVSENISNALKSALIRVFYSEDMMPGTINEASLRLFYWNDTNRGWEPIAVCGINTKENYVEAEVSHFSIYGIGEFNFPPVANAGKPQQTGIGEDLRFTGTATDHFNRNIIVLYEWDFDGDGSYDWNSTTTGVATYNYVSPGTYYAKLRVTDDGGGRGFDTVEVVVKEKEDDAGSSGLVEVITLLGVLALVSVLLSLKNGGGKDGPMFSRHRGGNGLLLLAVLVLLMNAMILLPCEGEGASGDDCSCDTTIIDISSSNYRPAEGEEVTISAQVYNQGVNNTYTTVWFGYLGNFSAIGEGYTFTEPGEVGVVELDLDTSKLEGEKTIFVIIKNSEPAESNISNNVGAATITLDIQPVEDDEETQLWESPLVLLLAGIVCVGSLLYYTKKRKQAPFLMNDVFLVYHDGRLILHETTRLRPDFDAMIMSGMLTAVQKFVRDSFCKGEKEGELKQLRYEDLYIIIESGNHVYCCVSISTSSEIPVEIRDWLKEAIVSIEDEFRGVLETWDGNIYSLQGAKDIIRETIILREQE